MTKTNCTAKKPYHQSSVSIGDVLCTNEGCKFTVIGYKNKNNVTIQFNDEYRHTVQTKTVTIKKGSLKNPYHPSVCGVGWFGVGDYISHANGRHTTEYQAWRDMVRRCYDPKTHAKHPTYIGCTISEDWCDFQVFAEWYTNQKYYNKGYHLDKDLLFCGNKVYSSKTCCLIPKEINALINNKREPKHSLPTGVRVDKKSGRYVVGMTADSNNHHIGYYDCYKDAGDAYISARKEYVKRKALEWRGRIESHVFEALISKTI